MLMKNHTFGFVSFCCLQSNVQKAQKNWCRDKVFGGKIIKSGYAPILFCIILFPTVLFMNSVLAGIHILVLPVFP